MIKLFTSRRETLLTPLDVSSFTNNLKTLRKFTQIQKIKVICLFGIDKLKIIIENWKITYASA